MVQYLSFHTSFSCIKIFLNMNSQASVTHPLLYVMASFANYESLGRIVGTAFWRAPEVLQALQDLDKTCLFQELRCLQLPDVVL
jgi:hypothetical protein